MQTKMNEIGRSMIEILGVLAVIGVLSVGAVAGYRYAMDKYRANDIVYEVNMRATDVWHRFQDKPLPALGDETAFSEWNNTTQTGYPITISPFPDVAFKIGVQNVSSRVCKNVMTMNLHQIIEGFQFAQINGAKYLGDASLCGNDETINEIVFTSFLDSQDPNTQHCVEDSDCHSKCAEKVCNGETMTCDDQCPEWSKPVRLEETCECVECVKNSDCKFKGEGYICDETTYTCSALQKVCPAGTFRTQNGACVACDNGSNFIVLKNGEPFPNTEDTVDGYTMCQQCADSGTERQYGTLVDDVERAYCSFMCTKGYSYQSSNEGCIPCSNMDAHKIKNETISKEQCLACPNHEWYFHSDYYCRGSDIECPYGEYRTAPNGTCVSCAETTLWREIIFLTWTAWGNIPNKVTEMCNNCPETVNGKPAKRMYTSGGCYKVCEQPENAEEQIEICQANPKDERCTRKWQSAKDAKCYDCDAVNIGDATMMHYWNTVIPELKDLCEKCGRKVNEKGYCVPKDASACPLGQIMSRNGSCKPCPKSANNYQNVDIINGEDSGCTKNCRMKDGKYSVDSDATDTTWVHGQQCVAICPDNMWMDGSNYDCNNCSYRATSQYGNVNWISEDTCEKPCSTTPYKRIKVGNHCLLESCGVNSKGQILFTGQYGICYSCSSSGPVNSLIINGIDECSLCEERTRLNNKCILINPGVSGICNDIENTFSDWVSDNIKNKAQAWLNGSHNGETFRDNDGYCRDCDSNTSFTSSQAQCASCKNRRYESGTCLKGLCVEGDNFLNTQATCIACTNKNIPVNPDVVNLCSSCEDRRMLTSGFKNHGNWAGLCVEECAGTQWQDINGNCLFCSEGGTREIGTDAESRRLCNECDGLREEQAIYGTDGTTVIGYKCVLKTTE